MELGWLLYIIIVIICLQQLQGRYTVFHRINVAATILFTEHNLRLQFEGGH